MNSSQRMEEGFKVESATAAHTVAGRLRSLSASQSPSGPTILLVEDEDFVREVTSQVLQSAGYVVLHARDAAEGVRVFHEHAPQVSLLLTDVVMPGKSGTELARELKVVCPSIRTIFMSGYPEVPEREGEDGEFYLPKPFSAGALLRKIRDVLVHRDPIETADLLRHMAGSR